MFVSTFWPTYVPEDIKIIKMNIFRKFTNFKISSLHALRQATPAVQRRLGSDVNDAICVCEAPRLDNQTVLSTQRQLLEKSRHEEALSLCGGGTTKITPLTGVPKAHVNERRVRIYEVSKNAMQSGTHTVTGFKLEFETRERWENPLMGWVSSGDPLSSLRIWFPTEKEAIAFCDKNEWRWFLERPPNKPVKKALRPGSYASNYSWDKRTRKQMK